MKATTTRTQDCSSGRTGIGRAANRRRRTGGTILAVALLGMLAFAASPASAQEPCPVGQGYWKNHAAAWQLSSLPLGASYTVTATQALNLLKTPVRGDASVILSYQLIAALLNIASGSTVGPASAAIADARAAIGAGPLPLGVHPSSALGHRMVADAEILEAYNDGTLTPACGPTPVPPAGSCQPVSSLSVLVDGTAKTVVSYVPKGFFNGGVSGVSAVNVEGSSITPTLIPTPGVSVVNSCASNPNSGTTVCTANNRDIFLLAGTTLASTLTSGGSGFINFFDSSCTNCGVVMDAVHNRALIALSTGTAVSGGYQFLDLSTAPPTLGSVFASKAPADTIDNLFGNISEGILIDPTRNTSGGAGALLLSANQLGTYEIADVTAPATPAFFENSLSGLGIFSGSGLWPASSGEDCTTAIALAPVQFSTPSQVYLADLRQAKFQAGTPGTWTSSASQIQHLSESLLSSGANGIAVAQGTHTGVVTGKIGGGSLTAIALPTTSGSGVPAIGDWVTCNIPGFSMGYDPHTVTAYRSPNSGHAIAVLANQTADSLAVVDLTKMLNPTLVPRTGAGHACASGTRQAEAGRGAISRSSGSSARQRSVAAAQRGAKAQPGGSRARSGGSPGIVKSSAPLA